MEEKLKMKKEDAVRTLINTILVALGCVVPAYAAGGHSTGTSILLIMFLGFFALIVVFQFIPGLVLFYNMLKGVFMKANKEAHADTKR